MDDKRQHWTAVRKLFDEIVDQPPAQREAVLARAGVAADIVRETRELLEAADHVGSFMEPISSADDIAPYSSLKAGDRVGVFRIEELIGRGGQGEVYRATRADGQFEQTVALKLLRPEAAQHFERFRNERQILAGLEHPGIARLVDGGIAPDGRPHAAMEYVAGIDIVEYCTTKNLDVAARLRLFIEVCAAVAYAHRNLVVHRDLKPGNILVTEDGHAKLLDFGIARLLRDNEQTAMTEAVATPDYTAPASAEIELALRQTKDAFGEKHLYYAQALLIRAAVNIQYGRFDAAQLDIDGADVIVKEAGAAGRALAPDVARLRSALAEASSDKGTRQRAPQ